MTTVALEPADDLVLGQYYRATWNGGACPNNLYSGFACLFRFDLSSIPASASIDSAYIRLVQVSAPEGAYNATQAFYKISDANGDWIEGTKNNTLAGAGEPCYNAKCADGAGGVTTAWAGGAGCKAAGTDYVNTILASKVTNRSDSQYTAYQIDFNADGLAVLESWFGEATNNGLLLKEYVNSAIWGLKEHATADYRPLLSVTYTEAASGALLKVNMNGNMQSLTGGFHG